MLKRHCRRSLTSNQLAWCPSHSPETTADPQVANLMDRQLHRPRRSGKLGWLALDRIRTLPHLPHTVHYTKLWDVRTLPLPSILLPSPTCDLLNRPYERTACLTVRQMESTGVPSSGAYTVAFDVRTLCVSVFYPGTGKDRRYLPSAGFFIGSFVTAVWAVATCTCLYPTPSLHSRILQRMLVRLDVA